MKERLFKPIFVMILPLLLASCGYSSITETELKEVNLTAGHIVAVGKDDSLIPTSANTRINITHILQDGRKSVTILRGSAKLIRGKYAKSP